MPSLNSCAIVGLALALCSFMAGWGINSWRLGAAQSEQTAKTARADADAAQRALADLIGASIAVHTAAAEYAGIQDKLAVKIDSIQKALKNAPPPPLPPDCHPTVDRVRAVSDAIGAANTAAAATR